MSDLVNTFRSYALDKDNCPRMDTEVVYVRVGLLKEAADRIEQLEAENASLASWQCEFTDGKTGLVYGEGGSTYCAMAKRVKELEGQHKGLVLQNALLRQRRDLPVDRIPAAQEVDAMRARIAQLEAALRDVLQEAADHHAESVSRVTVGGSDMAQRKAKAIVSRSGVLLYKIRFIARAALEERT